MKCNRFVAALIGVSGLCAGLLPTISAQTPSQPPRPSNPQPRPIDPKSPSQPGSPTQPPLPPGPTNPTTPANPNDPTNPSSPNNPALPSKLNQPANRNARLFAFQNPADEARFNEACQRLVRMEQKLDRSQQDQLRRLGEIRQMSAERQGPATMELMQQLLKTQADLQQYLISSRTLWTGDIDVGQSTDDPSRPVAPAQIQNPPR